MNRDAFVLALALSSLAGWSCVPVLAQDTSDDVEEGTIGKPYTEEIIVTARKREEDLQKVPVAVTPVSGEELEDHGAADISELQSLVPNLTIYQARSQSTTVTAFLRGIGQIDASWGVDSGVGIYLDDVYHARPQGALLDIFDVERIEVLRGPQGTLYGKNTIGGAIKYVSRPLTDETSGSLGFTAGDFGTLDFKASASGALVPGKLRAKAAVASLNRDGYGTNLFLDRDVSDKDTLAFRFALDWLVSDEVNVQFRLDRTEDDSAPMGLTRLETNPLCPSLGVTCEPFPDSFDVESGMEPVNRADFEGYALIADWGINDAWHLKSITSHRESDRRSNLDFDLSPAPLSDIFSASFEDQTTQELQLSYDGSGKLDGLFGLYYLDGTAGGNSDNIIFNFIFASIAGSTDTKSIALFGDGSYAISDSLTFNFGLRITEEEKRVTAFNAIYTDATFSTVLNRTADFVDSETFSSVLPRLGLDYTFSDDFMGYVSLSRGARSGGFNIRVQRPGDPEGAAEPFDDESLDMAEVGVKALLAGRSLRLNAAAFYGSYKDIQVSTFTSFDSDGDGVGDLPIASFVNAGEATITGLEVEYDWKSATVDWLGIAGNLAFLDASPDDFLDENNDGFVDSQMLSNAPDFSGLIQLNTNFPAFGGLIAASLGYSYRDDSVLTNEGGPDPRDPTRPLEPLVQPAFGLINAQIGWLSGGGTWQFTIHGRNLADEAYLLSGYNIPALGIVNGLMSAPRTVTATLRYNF